MARSSTREAIRVQRASKPFTCDACGGGIREGDQYLRIVDVPDTISRQEADGFVRETRAPIIREHVDGKCDDEV